MKVKAGTLKEYLKGTLENAVDHSEEPPDLMEAVYEMDRIFQKEFFDDEFDVSPCAGLLAMNSYILLLASVREALSGHSVSLFPVLRTALESACYCYLVALDREKVQIWTNRHSSLSALQKCRKTFTVKKATGQLKSLSPEMAEYINEHYEACINFGAHPNLRSITNHLSDIVDVDDSYLGFHLTGVYGRNSWEVNYALFICLELGQAIAFLFAAASKNHPFIHERLEVFQKWIDQKKMIEEELKRKA
ncbi:hypothetical protein [Pantoea sp. AMG 501]|uniref:hypothetical protein n=1 Tax=Pantoea sp. AMG 501 TaxID=2008894 RepID=UPI000B5A5374|nr:hypothetical protein [Pantoea sp. AMG 501]OWY74333.1 hypothetical protein CDN97_24095 [Pantoea sp. AMG 501]